jgi:hypothetical protein
MTATQDEVGEWIDRAVRESIPPQALSVTDVRVLSLQATLGVLPLTPLENVHAILEKLATFAWESALFVGPLLEPGELAPAPERRERERLDWAFYALPWESFVKLMRESHTKSHALVGLERGRPTTFSDLLLSQQMSHSRHGMSLRFVDLLALYLQLLSSSGDGSPTILSKDLLQAGFLRVLPLPTWKSPVVHLVPSVIRVVEEMSAARLNLVAHTTAATQFVTESIVSRAQVEQPASALVAERLWQLQHFVDRNKSEEPFDALAHVYRGFASFRAALSVQKGRFQLVPEDYIARWNKRAYLLQGPATILRVSRDENIRQAILSVATQSLSLSELIGRDPSALIHFYSSPAAGDVNALGLLYAAQIDSTEGQLPLYVYYTFPPTRPTTATATTADMDRFANVLREQRAEALAQIRLLEAAQFVPPSGSFVVVHRGLLQSSVAPKPLPVHAQNWALLEVARSIAATHGERVTVESERVERLFAAELGKKKGGVVIARITSPAGGDMATYLSQFLGINILDRFQARFSQRRMALDLFHSLATTLIAIHDALTRKRRSKATDA